MPPCGKNWRAEAFPPGWNAVEIACGCRHDMRLVRLQTLTSAPLPNPMFP